MKLFEKFILGLDLLLAVLIIVMIIFEMCKSSAITFCLMLIVNAIGIGMTANVPKK